LKYILRNQTRRPRDTSPHVSLFPFLAVLICTMGALVPLLFTISRQARLQAEQAATAKTEEIKSDVKAEREMVQWRIEQMQTSRKKTEAEIETARLELGHLEDHSRRLKAKISELEKTIGQIDRSANNDGHAATAAELEELRRQIIVAERQLAEAKTKAEGKKRSFAIIPYEGPNSTHRRPIYIECRGDSVVLQPEGIVLDVHDFEGPMGPSNPLAAALRTEREFLLSQHGFDPQRDGEPYPLLLVRPDGIIAYYAARAAMKSWGPEFGYEFVDDDWKLAYQPPDPQLSLALNDAVASARAVQQRLIAAAPRQYSRTSSSGTLGSSSRGGGGSGSGSGSGAGGMSGSSSRGSGRPQGSSGSPGSGGSNSGSGVGFGGAGEGDGGDFDSWDTNRPMPGAPDPFLAGVNNPYASLAVGGAGTGGSGSPGSGPAYGGGNGTGTGGSGMQGSGPAYGGGNGSGTGRSGTQGTGVAYGGDNGNGGGGSGMKGSGSAYGGGNGSGAGGAGPALGAANGSGMAGPGGAGGVGGTSGNSNGMAGGGYSQGGGQASGQGVAQGSEGSQSNGLQGNSGMGAPGSSGMSGGSGSQVNSSGQGAAVGYGNMTAGQGGNWGTATKGQTTTAGQADTQGQGRAGQSKRSDEPPDIFASRVAASNAAKNVTDNRKPADSSTSFSGQTAPPLHPGEWHEKPPELPPEPVVQVKGKKKETPPKHHNQDWGLRDTAHGSVPITRPVILECQADKLLLLPDRGRGGNPVVVMASETESSIDDVVSAIWDRMGQWGMAGRGMYWRPVLHVRVAAGGEQRFSDLQVLLQNSGLDVVRQ
jgi:hypothetical protein